jgi:prephenate dehydratase|tara:strand:- start:515 stop:1345 length:831 start_codon:yes stop_codon:yes gene_type:complete
MKITYQGIPGSYSESCVKEYYPNCETISCKTFDECFEKAYKDSSIKAIIPESNKTTGNIGVEYLIFKYRLNIYAEHFYQINHNLLGIQGSKITDIKNVYSHAQALSQSSEFLKKNKFISNVRADTAGSAKYVSEENDKSKGAIASKLSSKIYNLELIKANIQDDKKNMTRFLIMGKDIFQPEFNEQNNYVTSMLFKLKSKPAALYSALSGFALNGVNLIKLQSFPEKNSFLSYFFLCELDGHIENTKVKRSLEELGLHCEDMHVLGVFKADKLREK